MIVNEIAENYVIALTVNSNGKVEFLCEEHYLTRNHTDEILVERVNKLAENSCRGEYARPKYITKTLTINPGEYYSKVSGRFSCADKQIADIEVGVKEICRSLLGPSYRSLSSGKN